MSTIAEFGVERIQLDPDSPFPPFPMWLRVPSDWAVLDTNPGTWQRSAQDLVDRTFSGCRLPARERRAAMSVVEDLVADCQRAGAALSLLTLGRRGGADGPVVSAGIHLAFVDDGRPAALGRVHDMLPRSGVNNELEAPAGSGLVHQDRMTMMVPGTATAKVLTSIQAFLPLPGTTWTVVIATASAFAELTDPLVTLVRAMAQSVRLGPETDGERPRVATVESDATRASDATRGSDAALGSDAADDSADDWAAVECRGTTARVPGIERGFGTLVLRRLGVGPAGDNPACDSPAGEGRDAG